MPQAHAVVAAARIGRSAELAPCAGSTKDCRLGTEQEELISRSAALQSRADKREMVVSIRAECCCTQHRTGMSVHDEDERSSSGSRRLASDVQLRAGALRGESRLEPHRRLREVLEGWDDDCRGSATGPPFL